MSALTIITATVAEIVTKQNIEDLKCSGSFSQSDTLYIMLRCDDGIHRKEGTPQQRYPNYSFHSILHFEAPGCTTPLVFLAVDQDKVFLTKNVTIDDIALGGNKTFEFTSHREGRRCGGRICDPATCNSEDDILEHFSAWKKLAQTPL
eukprot:Pgem_evm1s4274